MSDQHQHVVSKTLRKEKVGEVLPSNGIFTCYHSKLCDFVRYFLGWGHGEYIEYKKESPHRYKNNSISKKDENYRHEHRKSDIKSNYG